MEMRKEMNYVVSYFGLHVNSINNQSHFNTSQVYV